MKIRRAKMTDFDILRRYNKHIEEAELAAVISLERIYIIEAENSFAGWLRYGLFWDNTPFMNMLYLLEEYRSRGLGSALVSHWERELLARGFSTVMTSTASDEYAQHFYHKLGYRAVGGFTPW